MPPTTQILALRGTSCVPGAGSTATSVAHTHATLARAGVVDRSSNANTSVGRRIPYYGCRRRGAHPNNQRLGRSIPLAMLAVASDARRSAAHARSAATSVVDLRE